MTVVLDADNVTFDCNGQTIDNRHALGSRDSHRGILAPYTRSVSDVRIEHCTIRNVGSYGVDLKRKFRGDELLTSMPGHERIVIDDVSISNTGKIGVYVGQNSRDVVLSRMVIDNTYFGVYLEAGSENTLITHSRISNTRNREGVAIDSSIGNVIEDTVFSNTNGANVRLYHNCGEIQGQVCPLARPLGASFNVLRNNQFDGDVVVAWRQGKLYWSEWCAELNGEIGRMRDNAKYNVFYGNTFRDGNLDIRDSENDVYGNRFLGDSKLILRGGFFNPPIVLRGIEVADNVFERGEIELEFADRFYLFPFAPSGTDVVRASYTNNKRTNGTCLVDEGNRCDAAIPATVHGAWMGILGWSGAELAPQARAQMSDWLGSWNFSGREAIDAVGDFTGNGRDNWILRSPWGLGVMEVVGGRIRAVRMARNGQRYGGWVLGAADEVLGGGDFDGDGRDDFIVRSGWGLGVLTADRAGFRDIAMRRHNSYFGWWRFTKYQELIGVGDFDGDERDEMVLRDARAGYAIVGVDARGGFRLESIIPFGTRLGGVGFNVFTRAAGVGDFDEDGRDDLAIMGSYGVAVISQDGSSARSIAFARYGTSIGWWRLDSRERAVAIGDFDGNGRADLVLADNRVGLGFLGVASGRFVLNALSPYGARYGGWVLSTNTRVVGAGDIDDDGRDDLIVRSGWGMGILRPIGGWMSSLWMNAWGWPGPLAPDSSGPIWPIAEADADPIVLDADGSRGVELLMRR